MNTVSAIVFSLIIALGLAAAGHFIGAGFVSARALERTVAVKGLSEREVPADTAIWPLQFNSADNDLDALLKRIENQTQSVVAYLKSQGFSNEELTVSPPSVTDKQAQSYGNGDVVFRYLAQQVVTVYTNKIDQVIEANRGLMELAKTGIVFGQDDYKYRTEFLFNGLNELKPGMVEEATQNARLVAEKFAADSASRLGRIKTASQGQFTISDRDTNNPHIKKVRIVSTLEYYLAD